VGRRDGASPLFEDEYEHMINEGVVLLAGAAAVIAALLAALPRCPECGCIRSVPDAADPALRHCRRCLTVYEPGGRR